MPEQEQKNNEAQMEGVFVKSIINQAQTMILNGVTREEIESALGDELTSQLAGLKSELKKELLTGEQVREIVNTVVGETMAKEVARPMEPSEVDALAQALLAKLGSKVPTELAELQLGVEEGCKRTRTSRIAKGKTALGIGFAAGKTLQWEVEVYRMCRKCHQHHFLHRPGMPHYGNPDLLWYLHLLLGHRALGFTIKRTDGRSLYAANYRVGHNETRRYHHYIGVSEQGRGLLQLRGRDDSLKTVKVSVWMQSDIS